MAQQTQIQNALANVLARWRSLKVCDVCHGMRLNPTALAWRIGDYNIAELSRISVAELAKWLEEAFPSNNKTTPGDSESDDDNTRGIPDLLNKLQQRLGYLIGIGLGYLSLDRPLSSLGSGERQRVALARAAGFGACESAVRP